MNAAELSRAMFAAKKEIDEAMAEFERAIRADAEADRKARIAKSTDCPLNPYFEVAEEYVREWEG